MTGPALRSAEISGAVAALSRIDVSEEIHDPYPWDDLVFSDAETSAVVARRTVDGFGPRRVQFFPWPKDAGGHRLFSIVDPFDRIVFHAASGRMAAPIAAGTLKDAPSFELSVSGPGYGWALTSGKKLHGRRVRLAKVLLGDPPERTLITGDVRNHFGSTSIEALERALERLWVDERTSAAALGWLKSFQTTHDGSGVPLGHDGSRLMAHAALIPADESLRESGIDFVRWVDDFWLIVDSGNVAPETVAALAAAISLSDYELNDSKTAIYPPHLALEAVESLAIASTIERERSGGGDEAAFELFEDARTTPAESASELRWSLGALSRKLNPNAASYLFDHPQVIDLAHAAAVGYLKNLAASKKTRSHVDLDALMYFATDRETIQHHPYRSLAALKVLATMSVGPDRARQLRELATGEMKVQSSLRTWAVRATQNSKPLRGGAAVDGVLQSAGVDVKRAFALTLSGQVDHRDIRKWTDRIAADEQDLAPTVAWLRAGSPPVP